jgi:uncharacterized C2H2 Zn-finger protein
MNQPEKFAVGSLESRAAVRMKLVRLNASRKRLRIIGSIPRPRADNSRVHFGDWQEWQDGTLGQQVYVPHVWVMPGEAIPACPDCGTPFKETKRYDNMVGYAANCIDKHDPELLGREARHRTDWRGTP